MIAHAHRKADAESPIDEEVLQFLADHPAGTIVELGCRLTARFERLDNHRVNWIYVDTLDAMQVRRMSLWNNPRQTLLASCLLDTAWIACVEASPPPRCFIAEACFQDLREADAELLVKRLCLRFPGALLLAGATHAPSCLRWLGRETHGRQQVNRFVLPRGDSVAFLD